MDSNYKTYLDIKNEVINSWIKSSNKDVTLIRLKNNYKNKINSLRLMDHLDSPYALINILEKRGCLSCENLQPLKEIARHLENSLLLLSRIDDCEKTLLNRNNNKQQYYYMIIKPPAFIKEIPGNGRPHQNDLPKRQIEVYKMLSMEIGKSWKNIARQLSINEGSIDNIECTYGNDLKLKISKVLSVFEHKTDPNMWMNTLCEALEKSRRKDLRDKVEFIMNSSLK